MKEHDLIGKTFAFDIDGTLCSLTNGDYAAAIPFESRISHVNSLHARGAVILLFTARGASSGVNHQELTEKQLEQWGVFYTKLIFGKPHADLFIDDKAINANQYDWEG